MVIVSNKTRSAGTGVVNESAIGQTGEASRGCVVASKTRFTAIESLCYTHGSCIIFVSTFACASISVRIKLSKGSTIAALAVVR